MARRQLGQILRKLREDRGLTQAQAAKLAGVEPAYLSQVETGARANPRWETIARIAYALGASLDHVAHLCGMKVPARLVGTIERADSAADIRDARKQLHRADAMLEALEKNLGS